MAVLVLCHFYYVHAVHYLPVIEAAALSASPDGTLLMPDRCLFSSSILQPAPRIERAFVLVK